MSEEIIVGHLSNYILPLPLLVCIFALVLCSQAPEVGFCKGYFPRYFHNSTSKQCEKFIYGGCGGNANKFRTLSQCQQTCSELVYNN